MGKLLRCATIFSIFVVSHSVLSIDINDKDKLAQLFQEIYQENKTAEVVATQEPRIPLKIHQIWIGPNPLPERYRWMMETWRTMHPAWEYKLWTNDDLENFPFINREAFDSASNWGMKADIWRYEILYYYGGVYVDLDFESIKAFDALNYTYDFYAGLMVPHRLNNALIGSAPFSPVLARMIESLGQRVEQIKNCEPRDWMGIINSTGPGFITEMVADHFISCNKDSRQGIIVLPEPYFYPLPNKNHHEYWHGKISRDQLLAYCRPETHAVHYWGTSWQTLKASSSKQATESDPATTDKPRRYETEDKEHAAAQVRSILDRWYDKKRAKSANNALGDKPKIAICYWGLTRSTKKVYQTHFENIFDVLQGNNIEYDVFMHTWRLEGPHYVQGAAVNTPLDYEEYKLLQPDYYCIDEQEEFTSNLDFSQYFYQSVWDEKGDRYDGEWRPRLLFNYLCALESQKRVTDMVIATGNAYDFIMYVRPDVTIKTKLNLDDILTLQPVEIAIPNFDHYEGYNDRFAIMPYEIAPLYGKRIDQLADFRKNCGRIVAEKYLKFTLDQNQLQACLIPFYFDRVRS